jgi:hypothetical protein
MWVRLLEWLRGQDLNLRPLGYEPNELPGCSTAHTYSSGIRSPFPSCTDIGQKKFAELKRQRPHKVGAAKNQPALQAEKGKKLRGFGLNTVAASRAVHQFNEGHGSVVTHTETHFQNAGVATRTGLETWTQVSKELDH